MTDDGAKVTTKEIYDLLLATRKSVDDLEWKVSRLEEMKPKFDVLLSESEEGFRLVSTVQEELKFIWKTFLYALIAGGVGGVFYFLSGGKWS